MMAIGKRAIFNPAKMLRRGMFLQKSGCGTRDVGRDKVKTEFLDYCSGLLIQLVL
jgi:hypothetical protein